jgi:hypothetical protein
LRGTRVLQAFEEIRRLFGSVPAGERIDWDAVQSQLALVLPVDYRHYCDRFPPGSVGALDVWHPASRYYSLQEAGDRLEYILASVDIDGDDWPDPDSLRLWGSISSTTIFCWDVSSSANPDEWPSVVFDTSLDIVRLGLTMTECLLGLMSGTLRNPIIPPEFESDDMLEMQLHHGGTYSINREAR